MKGHLLYALGHVHPCIVSVGVVGQAAPQETVQPLVTHASSDSPLHASPPFAAEGFVQVRVRSPAVAPSVRRAVHPQALQSVQPPSTGQFLAATVQEVPLILQVPASPASARSAVQAQTPQSTGQLFAATVQGPLPSDQAPAFDASVVEEVQSQVRGGQLCVLQD